MYRVIRAFDRYRPGQTMTAEDVADQERRGNLPDLIKNGFVGDSRRVEGGKEAAESVGAPTVAPAKTTHRKKK